LELVSHRENVSRIGRYETLRLARLSDLLAVDFGLNFFGETRMTSTDLSLVWGKNFRGSNVSRYLETLAFVFEGDFEWCLVRKGRGRRPHLFEIKMSENLRERLEGDKNNVSLTPFNSLADIVTLPAEL
jgi:hypothetical protein